MQDPLSDHYRDLLEGRYDCVDRIVLNGRFPIASSGGGFRTWWRQLCGSDDNLDDTHLMRLAGRFSRRLRAFAQAKGIPLVECSAGERKHEMAEEYLRQHPGTVGLFMILVGRAPAPVWKVEGRGHHLTRKEPFPYVNHYSFHMVDAEWGHITLKICGHPPFAAQILLNGHEYVACRAKKVGIDFTKEGNCFTHITDAAGLARVADTLRSQDAIGRLSRVCERWIYSTCLCFALDEQEQLRSGFHYEYSIYQVEYSRNLLFHVGGQMDQVFQALVDRTRAPLGVDRIKTILGRQRRPKHRPHKNRRVRWGVVVETPTYDLTVFKIHCGRLTLKIYTKGERVLRIEVIVHNTKALRCRRSLPNFPSIVTSLRHILERFLEALSYMDVCFIGDDTLERMPLPARLGQSRVGGIDFNKLRVRRVTESILALSPFPRGFTASDLARKVRALSGQSELEYGPRRATYDLKKFRAKKLVRKIEFTRRYQATPRGLRALTALLVLRDKVIQPLLAAACHLKRGRKPNNFTPVDQHYETLRLGMRNLFQELGLAA